MERRGSPYVFETCVHFVMLAGREKEGTIMRLRLVGTFFSLLLPPSCFGTWRIYVAGKKVGPRLSMRE